MILFAQNSNNFKRFYGNFYQYYRCAFTLSHTLNVGEKLSNNHNLIEIPIISKPSEIHVTPVHGNSRKRAKTSSPPLYDSSVSAISMQDATNDDLLNVNAVFNSTTLEEDEIVAGTQMNESKTILHKPIRSATYNTKSSNEQNKENNGGRSGMTSAVEKSPTLLSKRTKKPSNERAVTPERILSPKKDNESNIKSAQSSSTSNESPKWKRKNSKKTATPRRLFDKWPSSATQRSPSSPQQSGSIMRTKLFLSNQSRMKQSTLKFPKVSDNIQTNDICLHNTNLKNVKLILNSCLFSYLLNLLNEIDNHYIIFDNLFDFPNFYFNLKSKQKQMKHIVRIILIVYRLQFLMSTLKPKKLRMIHRKQVAKISTPN